MLVINQLNLSRNHQEILNQISIDVMEGDFIIIIGPNGSGKSSLLRCISTWYSVDKNTIKWEQKCISTLSPQQRAACISFLPQKNHVSESIEVYELIIAARYRFMESRAISKKVAIDLLAHNHIEHLSHRDWHTLSGGEAQRVALACMQAQSAKVWLLDEPANHLDPAVQRSMYKNLVQEWHLGRTMILVTHNINLILGALHQKEYSKVRIIGLKDKRIHFDVALDHIKLTEYVSQLYAVPVQCVDAFDRKHFVFGTP